MKSDKPDGRNATNQTEKYEENLDYKENEKIWKALKNKSILSNEQK